MTKKLSQKSKSSGPLSLRERVRVRAGSKKAVALCDAAHNALTPGPSPKGRGELLR